MDLPIKPYYQDEFCTVYNAECTQVVPFLEPVALLLTDPPYGIGADKMTLGNGKRKLFRGSTEWDAEVPAEWVFEMIHAKATHSIIWGGNYFALPATRCLLFWDKGSGDNDYADGEIAWTNLDMVVKKYFQQWVGANAKDKGSERVHPTQKPLGLMRWCMSLVPDAETILDPFMGSGTTLVAAKLEGRHAIGIEREERYCESAVKRLLQNTLF